MVAPEARENHTSGYAALLLGSVETGGVEESELKPGRGRVAVGKSSLIGLPVLVGGVVQLSLVGVAIASVILKQLFVVLLEFCSQVNFAVALFPVAHLTRSPAFFSVHFL